MAVMKQHTDCNTLQHTVTHCNIRIYIEMWVPQRILAVMNQHAASHCNTQHHTATHCNTLQHTATHCNTLQHTATHCNTLQHILTCTNVGAGKTMMTVHQKTAEKLQHTATHCNKLQQTATHVNIYKCGCRKENRA